MCVSAGWRRQIKAPGNGYWGSEGLSARALGTEMYSRRRRSLEEREGSSGDIGGAVEEEKKNLMEQRQSYYYEDSDTDRRL